MAETMIVRHRTGIEIEKLLVPEVIEQDFTPGLGSSISGQASERRIRDGLDGISGMNSCMFPSATTVAEGHFVQHFGQSAWRCGKTSLFEVAAAIECDV